MSATCDRHGQASLNVSTCTACHTREAAALQNSLHNTLSGILNQTRYLWGAQHSSTWSRFGLGGGLHPLPPSPTLAARPADLVDDFLRNACLDCHAGPNCTICHGQNKTPGDALPIPDERCLQCHTQNHVGADYHGLFEADLHPMFHPVGREQSHPGYHGLAPDIHYARGLVCVDCHDGADVMGDGTRDHFALERSRVSCVDCHGGFTSPTPKKNARIGTKGSTYIFHDANGVAHALPLFSQNIPQHDRQRHARIRCSACHAQWTFQDYGFEAVRRDDGLAGQQAMALAGTQKARGGWFLAWRLRRWEGRILGVDHKGRISAMRPWHQYRISLVNSQGQVVLDGAVPLRGDFSRRGWAFAPYTPHTIGAKGQTCDACHGAYLTAGKGLYPTHPQDDVFSLTMPSPPSLPGMRLLTESEMRQLLTPSKLYATARYQALTTRALTTQTKGEEQP